MSALPNDLPVVGAAKNPIHKYHAAADVLYADIEQPIQEKVSPQARIVLPKDGHYQYRHADPFHLEGILSYKGGYTQVAGHPSTKSRGFTTLSTSVVEGLNLFHVVTADRIVAQISTTHPYYDEGQVPTVTFLGTRFDNLRIDGREIKIDYDLEILGPRPNPDGSYLDDSGVQQGISRQQSQFLTIPSLPDWAAQERPSILSNGNGHREMRCSLVSGVKGCPGSPFGHVIHLPHFGTIVLGDLTVTQTKGKTRDDGTRQNDTYHFKLTMIKTIMGCLGKGTSGAGNNETNGQGGDDH